MQNEQLVKANEDLEEKNDKLTKENSTLKANLYEKAEENHQLNNKIKMLNLLVNNLENEKERNNNRIY